jgi:hypothetical protein
VQKFQTAGANTVIIVEGLATEYRLSGRTTYRPVLMFTSVLDVNSATASSWVIGNLPGAIGESRASWRGSGMRSRRP